MFPDHSLLTSRAIPLVQLSLGLEDWPSYKAQPRQEDLPKDQSPSELKCCQIADNKLVLPSDVRSMFLTCPVFDPKWRELLSSFYKQWAAPVGELRPNQSPIKHPCKTETKTDENLSKVHDAFPGTKKRMRH